MASKKDILATVLAVCASFNAPKELTDELTNVLAPKTGGASINIDEVYNAEDNTLLCSVSGVWLPATVEYFYEDKTGTGIAGTGVKRLSRQAESIRKQTIKVLNASEKAIMTDVLNGEMTPEEGTAALNAAKAIKPDFSSVEA